MANIITASIYSYQGNPDFTDASGVVMGFTVSEILIKPLDPYQVFNGVTCRSTIEVIKGDLPFPIYFASEEASTLIADANSGGGGGTVTSVGLTMPSAFLISGSPVTTSGTIAVSGAGDVSQYIRGDGTLADFPSGGGGGASVNYYMNGGTLQGTYIGNTYYQMDRTADTGVNVDFTIAANGYIAQFLTDPGDPGLLLVPAGNWAFETFFSVSSALSSPSYYIELYKFDGVNFTLIASNVLTPELIVGGTSIEINYTSVSVPATSLLITDRLAVRYYVFNDGATVTLHTQSFHLAEAHTTFTTGINTLNSLTSQVQYFSTGTSGTDFSINSSVNNHTFDLPVASAVNTGKLSNIDWIDFDGKQDALILTTTGSSGPATLIGATLNIPEYQSSYLVTTVTSNYIALATVGQFIILCDSTSGLLNISLPSAVGNNCEFTIKKIAGTFNIVIDASGTQTIDGGLTATLVVLYESITIISDNSNWHII